MHQLWGIFVVPSLLRTPSNESVRLQERLKRHFFYNTCSFTTSPLEPSTNSEPIEPTPKRKVRAGEDEGRDEDVDLPDASHISPLVVHWHLNTMPRI